jgi:hypothetical protein
MHKVALYFSTPAVNRKQVANKRRVLSVKGKF